MSELEALRAEVERLRESVRWGDKFLRERNELLEAVDLWKDEYEREVAAKAEWMREANRMCEERDEARARLGVGGIAHDAATCCCADCCVLRELRAEVERLKVERDQLDWKHMEVCAELERLKWARESACENTPTKDCECPGCETARERAERGEA